jgi:hypothetical protein
MPPSGQRPSFQRPQFLRPVAGRRGGPGRAGGLFNLTRLLGALLMLAASAALNWLTAPDHFELDRAGVAIEGLRYTSAQEAEAIVGPSVAGRPNLFRLRSQAIARELVALPAVAAVEIEAALPDRLTIRVIERVPVLVWNVGATSLLVDAEGVAISEVSGPAAGLPTVTDRRREATVPEIGGRLDSIDLAAALRLAALTPAMLDSTATGFGLDVEDGDGWLLSAEPPMRWRAAFGHYTPNLRPTTIIDQQVQCLRSLLASGEAQLETIFLAPSEDRCGTFRARPTPSGRIFQNVGGTNQRGTLAGRAAVAAREA